MNSILPLLASPVLGAFIGYLTNYVAIRMLFRPLRAWRLFGFTLPMTPGVIPKKRDQLAENIGKMVGNHLLTSTDVQQALSEQGFHRELRNLLDSRLDHLMHRDLGPVATLVPERFRGYFETGIRIFTWRISRHLHKYLASARFAGDVSAIVDRRLEQILAAELGLLVQEPARARVGDALEKSISRLFAGPGFEAWLEESLKRRLSAMLAAERTLADLLPGSFLQLLLQRLEQETPKLLNRIAGALEEPAMQDRIARAIVASLQKLIASMGPMASLLGGFLNPEAVDRRIRSYLAEHREELLRWQHDEMVQRRLTLLLREKVELLFNTPVSNLLARVNPEMQVAIRGEMAALLVALLRKPEVAAFCGKLLRQGLEEQASRPLGDLLIDLAGKEGVAKGREWAAEEVIALLRSPETKKILERMISETLQRLAFEQPLGSLADFLPGGVRKGISDLLLAQTSDLLSREVPGLVDSLNVQQMVARKVGSLDLLSLEGLLLGIMQEQFKYINILGAILGLMIGSLNLLLILFF
jgi:uncharacterized membrane protein YheB (UPF0754 family)